MDGKWKLLGIKEGSMGYRPRFTYTYEMPKGKQVEFDMGGGKDGVSVFAITKDNKVVVVTQYRPGPDSLTVELPGGAVDEGETPQNAAARELLEETGYAGSEPVLLGHSQHPYALYKSYSVLIRDCEKVSDQNLDDTEDIEVGDIPLDVFLEHVVDDSAADNATFYRALKYMGYLKFDIPK